jgi:adenine-specific DNA-methyltransferase
LLADSVEGRRKEQELTGRADFDNGHPLGDIRQGFIYERVAANTSGSIANNSEIEVIYEKWQAILEPLRADLTKALGKTWEDWEIPRDADVKWPAAARQAHEKWCEARLARQKAMDASIARAADVEMLYDRPYEDKSKVRVAGPFTVESLSPHRVVPADEEELIDLIEADEGARRRLHKIMPPTDFAEMVLEHLKSAGVHQSEKRDTIRFTALNPWPGVYVGAEGRFMEGEIERRAAIFIGPEFGTLTRVDLAAAAREALDARFDVLIACAFAFDAHASEVTKLGPLPILKAKMSPDLHMAGDLKNTGKGNLFVVFGEPDIDICHENDGRIVVKVKGVDVFDPNTGEIRANDTKGIAAWFIDTDYNEESFFVRHAYFLGANDPYKTLKTALQAEIDKDAWETLYRAESRPFERPTTGKIAVKVINHFGDEVMKVFRV